MCQTEEKQGQNKSVTFYKKFGLQEFDEILGGNDKF